MINYLFKNLKGTDWELLTDFVSPVFFDVVPTVGMAKVFATILKDYASHKEFKQALLGAGETLAAKVNRPGGSKVALVEKLPAANTIRNQSLADRQTYGAMVLRIYFAQIFSDHKTVLDLRSSAFCGMDSWSPKPVFYGWSHDFREGLRSLYRGFYESDDREFKVALERLNLVHAEAPIRGQFGEGSQDSVTFSLEYLKKSLHAVFVSCKESKARLHPDFFALGVYLLCLYENLEGLACPLDVRSAFNEAIKP